MKKPTQRSKKRKVKGKKKYRVRNWKEYNQALVDRGKVMFWITEEAIRKWEEQKKTGKRGKPRVFSDIAIETALTVRAWLYKYTCVQTSWQSVGGYPCAGD